MPSHRQTPRRTKIVATLGPSVAEPSKLGALLEAGVDVVRLNGSHGSQETHRAHFAAVRAAAAAKGRNVGVLFDLQGPKIRLGQLAAEGVAIAADEIVRFVPAGFSAQAKERAFVCDYPLLARDVAAGEPLLIDDGNVTFDIVEVDGEQVLARARQAGTLLTRKGINLPVSDVKLPALTDKDRADALFAAELGVDFLALSFVRRASDVLALVDWLAEHGHALPIISKIEKPQALTALDEILAASYGVMVARGDLGVELSYALVPMAQKRIIRAARRVGKPVITATQMLESMTKRASPTRAEASDVANAVLDGTDAVMLSAETASGDFPVQSVVAMGNIIDAVEQTKLPPKSPRNKRWAGLLTAGEDEPSALARDQHSAIPLAVAHAGCLVAGEVGAKALVAFTESGRMALFCSQQRPRMPIVAFAGRERVARCLTLSWGVCAVATGDAGFVPSRLSEVDAVLSDLRLAGQGEPVVLLVGASTEPSGTTNLMAVHRCGRRDTFAAAPSGKLPFALAEAPCDRPV